MTPASTEAQLLNEYFECRFCATPLSEAQSQCTNTENRKKYCSDGCVELDANLSN